LAKTLLESSTWHSTRCLLTWKWKVTPANRLLFQLAPSMPRTDGTESGLWATPQSFDAIGPDQTPEAREKRKQKGGCSNLREQVKLWPTPRAADGDKGSRTQEGYQKERDRLKQGVDLPTAVKTMWRTPRANDHKSGVNPAGKTEGQSGQLNPTWVEGLMGFPYGYTDIAEKE